jgi:eukaryotic-like serine/threonine-protein kinase
VIEQFGPYFIYEQLGRGGMAAVHRAEVAGRQVALKRMLPRTAADRELVRAFVREARIASYLDHPNIARTYELGVIADVHYIAMELVHGRNLRQVLHSCSQRRTHLPVPVALAIIAQLCDALDHAHTLCDEHGQPLGIIHRDVTLSNVLLADTGEAKLIDFGIAKASAAGLGTRGGKLKGKCGYMAPEYIRGSISARADLFALGVVAYELLTTHSLFAVPDNGATLRRVLEMPIEPPSRRNPAVPPVIDDLVLTALARDPAHRWQRASALRRALATVTNALGLYAVRESIARYAWDYEPGLAVGSASISTELETVAWDRDAAPAWPS